MSVYNGALIDLLISLKIYKFEMFSLHRALMRYMEQINQSDWFCYAKSRLNYFPHSKFRKINIKSVCTKGKYLPIFLPCQLGQLECLYGKMTGL